MKVSGQGLVHGEATRLSAVLADPDALRLAVPGCVACEATGADGYRLAVEVLVASVSGTYEGEVRLLERPSPGAMVLGVDGGGSTGTVAATVRVELKPIDGGATQLTYQADADVGGRLGGVGQRVLDGAARRWFDELVDGLELALTTSETPVGAGTSVEVGAGSSVTEDLPSEALPVGRRPEELAVAAVGGAVAALAGVAVVRLLRRRFSGD